MGGSYAFRCDRCRIELDDGVQYSRCPRCDGPLSALAVANPSFTTMVPTPRRLARVTFIALLVVQSVFAVADPHGFPYLGPLLVWMLVATLPGTAFAVVFVRAVRSLWSLRTRVLHGLEHATVAILAERGISVVGGQTVTGHFWLALDNDGRASGLEEAMRSAACEAIERVVAGDDELAYSDHCGTSLVVAAVSLSAAVAVVITYGFMAHVPTGYLFASVVAVGAIARLAARRLGRLAQRLLTVSTRLAAATVGRIAHEVALDGATVRYFVHVEVEVEPGAPSTIGEPV